MSQEPETIEDLSEATTKNTQKIAKYLRSEGLPLPSLDPDAPLGSIVPPEATEIQRARAEVINDTRNLRVLMLGPRDYLQSFKVMPRTAAKMIEHRRRSPS